MCESALTYSREIGLVDLKVTDSHDLYRAIENAIRQEVDSAQFHKDMSEALNRNAAVIEHSVHKPINCKH